MRTLRLLVLLAAACASREEPPEELPANRADVAQALHAQLDQVLKRRAQIREESGEDARREREELDRLADEIAVRIVRLDPHVDVEALVERLEASR